MGIIRRSISTQILCFIGKKGADPICISMSIKCDGSHIINLLNQKYRKEAIVEKPAILNNPELKEFH